mgnify:CR=1 FL=1
MLEKIPASLTDHIKSLDVSRGHSHSSDFNKEASTNKDEITRQPASDFQDGFNRRAKYRKMLLEHINKTRQFFSKKRKRRGLF